MDRVRGPMGLGAFVFAMVLVALVLGVAALGALSSITAEINGYGDVIYPNGIPVECGTLLDQQRPEFDADVIAELGPPSHGDRRSARRACEAARDDRRLMTVVSSSVGAGLLCLGVWSAAHRGIRR